MVDVPASPVSQLPHQRLARVETTSERPVKVIQNSSSRFFARKIKPETDSRRLGTVIAFTQSKAGIPRCFGGRIQQRFLLMKVLICYYSTYGNVYKMANLVAEGVSQVPGAESVVRRVPELIPAAVIESRADMK